jgi:2-polyprenyl-3-methyl-5-hydroxy-6-metoxy-1,4-benzoquinol methylase
LAEHGELHQRAIDYDIIFDRDVRREVNFIRDNRCCYAGRNPRSILDVACGLGYYAWEFARRGVRDLGLDLRPEMVEFAKRKDAREELTIEWIA